MNFILFLFFAILIFSLVLVGGKRYRSTALYALAIGGIVNSNFFNSINYPIICFGLPFGIDSIIYTLFIFCVIIMFFEENKKSAYLLAISSVIAIMFSAFMQLFASILSIGSSYEIWLTFLNFSISSFSSIIAITIMIEVINKLKTYVNNYWLLIIGMLITIVIDTTLHFSLSCIINDIPNSIIQLLTTSFIGKFISLIVSVLIYYIIQLTDEKGAVKK